MSLYLDTKYANMLSPYFERFKKKADHTWNMRCKFCGDSKTNKRKARGYIFRKSNDLFYKCHNCGIGLSLANLLKQTSIQLYNDYVMEKYSSGESGGCKNLGVPEKLNAFNQTNKVVENKLKLKKVSELDKDNIAYQYLTERKIPKNQFNLFYFVDDFQSWAMEITDGKFKQKYHTENTEPRLVIPFINQYNRLIALQARALNESKIRYITIKFVDYPKIFGLERWNRLNKTYIVEGPIDSLFIPNCLAMAGSSVDLEQLNLDKKNSVMIFDNEDRNKEIVRLMLGAVDKGYQICIWPKTNNFKDINDMILGGMTKEEILKQIEENTRFQLEAVLSINSWRRC